MTAIDEAREWLSMQNPTDLVGTISVGLVRELLQELDKRVQQPQQSTKSAPSGNQVGTNPAEEPKPCPECGAPAVFCRAGAYPSRYTWIECTECSASAPTIEEWNRRASSHEQVSTVRDTLDEPSGKSGELHKYRKLIAWLLPYLKARPGCDCFDALEEEIRERLQLSRDALQLDELSDVERQEAGYPATREELVSALRELLDAYIEENGDRMPSNDSHPAHVVRDILSREESHD